MKHVGKMKNNSAPVAIVFRTIPGDPYHCLVVGTQGLGDSYHDSLMSLIETPEAQGANELANILSARKFPDGNQMLGWLHTNGRLRKVATNEVIVTATPQDTIPLDELNKLIAEQKGITLEQLAGGDEVVDKTEQVATVTEMPVQPKKDEGILDDVALAKRLRSQADSMFKEAQSLRKQADELDPPAKKSKKTETV